MILTLVALALFAEPDPRTEAAALEKPALYIDACVEVDGAAVKNLVDLELRDAPSRDPEAPISVEVRCLDGSQEIRVEPWASVGGDGTRSIALPAADDADPAAREARSRELALAIAELIRRLEITQPLHPQPPPAPPPPPTLVLSTSAAPEEPHRRWRLAVLSSFEAFTGGQKMAGGDISFGARIGRWILGEVRVGGRFVDGQSSPVARLTGRAGTASVAIGPSIWSEHRTVGFEPMLRAQGYAIDYRAESPGDGGARTARLGALTVAAEPRLIVAISGRIALTAAVGVGIPLHGIMVRTQGAKTDSLTGVTISAGLGAAVTF